MEVVAVSLPWLKGKGWVGGDYFWPYKSAQAYCNSCTFFSQQGVWRGGVWVSFGRGSPPAVLFEHEAVRLFDFDGRRLTTWNDVTAPTRALADALRSPTKKGAYREEGAAPVLSLELF